MITTIGTAAGGSTAPGGDKDTIGSDLHGIDQ